MLSSSCVESDTDTGTGTGTGSSDANCNGCNATRLDMSRVVAPMVNQSDAPFRVLCLKYGATAAYTEMISAGLLCESPTGTYLSDVLPEADHSFYNGSPDLLHEYRYRSRPLIAQVCGNDPDVLAKASQMLADTGRVDAIDLNLGCPQDRAREGLFGSYLLDHCHWPRVFACVQAMVNALRKYELPLFCKIRLCERGSRDYLQPTIDFCEGLVSHGVSLICIHGRTRGSSKQRRCGAAHLDLIQQVAKHFQGRVPIVANGNIVTREDALKVGAETSPTVGVMSAEGLLADPALFSLSIDTMPNPTRIPIPDRYALFAEYCALSDAYKASDGWDALNRAKSKGTCTESHQLYCARQHLMFMLGKSGHGRTVRFEHRSSHYRKHTELLRDLQAATEMKQLQDIASRCLRGVHASPPFDEDESA